MEIHELAARADRRQLLICRRPDQDQQRTRRRLFQSFQEAVGRFFVQIVRIIDDGDSSPAPSRLEPESLAELANDFDGQFVLVFGSSDDDKIRMTSRRHLQTSWT